ncbi:hypothetical protein Tco_0750658 [Tanacetum coccineum]|uniref:Uncharacterized protein n=1 Tax=Tanacetum coccineum TaxID=301880 RepID=A0ABQ4Z510_9ASTR
MQSLIESHAHVIKQILCYLKGTTLFGIKYKRGNDMRLMGYSSHNVDIDDGWGTTGHVFYLGTSPVTWFSQKQTTVALSLCEAEFMAATAVACQAIWLREILAEVTGIERACIWRESKRRPINEGLGTHKVQGDEIVTWCARVTLFDSGFQGVIIGELSELVMS